MASTRLRNSSTVLCVVPPERFMRVVFPTALALLLCNMDRIVMSVAIVPMAAEYGWAPSIQVRPRITAAVA